MAIRNFLLGCGGRITHHGITHHASRITHHKLATCNLQLSSQHPRMHYWLVKSEPESYSWANLVKDGRTAWTGVRNFAARLNLRGMKKGDLVFFYHSVIEKQIVGIARVEKTAYPDPTATEGDWSAVDLVPVRPLKSPVSLDTIKSDKTLKGMLLVRQTRLSVTPVMAEQYERILKLAGS
jgi:predicted RNA-binding protein with PUA-like domain